MSNPVAPWTLARVPERARANRKRRTPVVTSPDAPAATWHPSKKRLDIVLEARSELSRMRTGIVRIGLEPSESEPSALLPSGFAAAPAGSAVDLWTAGPGRADRTGESEPARATWRRHGRKRATRLPTADPVLRPLPLSGCGAGVPDAEFCVRWQCSVYSIPVVDQARMPAELQPAPTRPVHRTNFVGNAVFSTETLPVLRKVDRNRWQTVFATVHLGVRNR